MSEDVEKLESLHSQLRHVRALLPQMIQKIAFVGDDAASVELFQGVAQDLNEWKTASVAFDTQYKELKPLMDKLNEGHADASG